MAGTFQVVPQYVNASLISLRGAAGGPMFLRDNATALSVAINGVGNVTGWRADLTPWDGKRLARAVGRLDRDAEMAKSKLWIALGSGDKPIRTDMAAAPRYGRVLC